MKRGTFVSFASVETGKAIGAIVFPDHVDVRIYPCDMSRETIEQARFYTREEMDALKYNRSTDGNRAKTSAKPT